MHSIMFRLSIFTMQLLVVGYNIFCEISVAHKELILFKTPMLQMDVYNSPPCQRRMHNKPNILPFFVPS